MNKTPDFECRRAAAKSGQGLCCQRPDPFNFLRVAKAEKEMWDGFPEVLRDMIISGAWKGTSLVSVKRPDAPIATEIEATVYLSPTLSNDDPGIDFVVAFVF
jgi:hypothetical protein